MRLSMEFDSFDFHPSIRFGIKRLGYATATPIQEQGLPPVLDGRDVIALAQTGTGKTAVFVLPILQRLISRSKGKPRALILAPTRELAEQTHEFFIGLGGRTDLRFITVYGGIKEGNQKKRIKNGVDIIVACPGRLLSFVEQGIVDLSKVEMLVLDEADRMFDMGFLPDVRKIIKQIPKARQTLLFSATMPADIRKLSHDVLRNPVTVQIDHTVPLETVSHAFYPVPRHLKTSLLKSIMESMDADSILVFTRTKHGAKRVARQMEKAGYSVASLQGNLSQHQRRVALEGFRRGSSQILVATDIAARGIDVSSISHVINYDIPDTADAYTHRIGRTGRAAKTGDAFTFITEDDEQMVRSIERTLGAKVERRRVDGFDYDQPEPPSYNRPRDSSSRAGKFQSSKPRAGQSKDVNPYARKPRAGKPKARSSKPAQGGAGRKPSQGRKKRPKQSGYRRNR